MWHRRREELLRSWAAPDVEADVREVPSGPASIESAYEEYLSVPALVEALVAAEREGFDAVIVGCFDDPGVDALRELATRTLVVGPGAAAMHVAGLLGGSFGIVTVPNPTATRKLVLTERLDARLVDIALVRLSVLEIATEVDATLDAMSSAGKELVARGAETIVLGCLSMAFLDVDAELGRRLGVPSSIRRRCPRSRRDARAGRAPAQPSGVPAAAKVREWQHDRGPPGACRLNEGLGCDRPPFGGSESLESSAAAAATLTPPAREVLRPKRGNAICRHIASPAACLKRTTRGCMEVLSCIS
jgi:allantoin racemase